MSPFSFSKVLTASLALVTLSASAASASTITVTEASFVAPTTVTFGTDGMWGGANPPYLENGATFTSPASPTPPAPDYFYTYDPGSVGDNILDLYHLVSDGTLDVSFDQTVGRFGFHAGTNPASAPPLGAGMNDYTVASVQFFGDAGFVNLVDTYTTPTTLSETGQGQTFFGLQSSNAFQSVRINFSNPYTGGGFSPYMDDFLFGPAAAPVPEPASTLVLLGLALGSVGLARWRTGRQ